VRHRSGGWGPPVQAGATGGDLGYARSEERRCFGHKEGLSSRCFGYGAVWGGEVGGRGARHGRRREDGLSGPWANSEGERSLNPPRKITVRNSSKGGIRITGGSKERRTKVDEGRVPGRCLERGELDGEGTTGRCDVEDRSVKEEGKGGGPTNPMRGEGFRSAAGERTPHIGEGAEGRAEEVTARCMPNNSLQVKQAFRSL